MKTKTEYTPFYARVGNVLDISPMFFNAVISSIIRELAQNARRAGATELEIEHIDKNHVLVRDNGHGCEPQDLMGFAVSEWGTNVQQKESPAGIGFWSLAQRGATVRCGRGWEMVLEKRHFTGELPIKPRACTPMPGVGLEITAGISPGSRMYGNDLKYYPFTKVTIDRDTQSSCKDFLDLECACEIYDFDGYSVQMTLDSVLDPSDGNRIPGDLSNKYNDVHTMVCYGGHVVSTYTGSKFPKYGVTVAGEYHRPTVKWIKVLVHNERALPPTLPQRDSVQEGDEFDNLQTRLLDIYEKSINHVFGEENIWRDENKKWAGCILSPNLSSTALPHGLMLKMTPVTVAQFEAYHTRMPCLNIGSCKETANLLLDVMWSTDTEVFIARNCPDYEDALWREDVYQSTVGEVRILHSSHAELFVGEDPQTELTALRVELRMPRGTVYLSCKWLVPFHCLYNKYIYNRDSQDLWLQAPTFFTDGSITDDDYEQLRAELLTLKENGKSLERASSHYWGDDKRPSGIITDALLRILDNLRDPIQAFENALKAAVEMACRRIPKSIWNSVSNATVTVDKDYVNVKLKSN